MNRTKAIHIILFTAFLFLIGSCSTRRNTGLSRNYHGLTARYNIYFNGHEAYLKGVERIENSLTDDYSRILPLFFYSIHDNLGKSDNEMDIAIEKAKKLIKKHSIKVKPKFKSSKAGDQKYRNWIKQEEFNVMVDDAYMLMGKAHFFKGEFMEAAGVFRYVSRHFSTQYVRYDAELWVARAYAELGWLYEAEDQLKKTNDDNFPFQLAGDFAAINADVNLKRGTYKDAIPFLKDAIEAEKDKKIKRRYLYVLAQIYQESDNFENALATYKEVLKMHPPYEMDFNARIKLTEVIQGKGNIEGIKKELTKMIKDEKNKEYLDQIYYALGNLELSQDHIDNAVENYELSIENSTQNPIQKGLSHITLADMYFRIGAYRDAQPHYASAASAFGDNYPGVRQIRNLAGVLNEMAGFYESIELEDSLQMVANLSPSEQNLLINTIIEQVKEEEKNASNAARKGESLLKLPGKSNWYFYNPQMLQSGRQDFAREWGNRKLEDNWRRSKKTNMGFNNLAQAESNSNDSVIVTDNKTREYYLQNIPSSEEAFKISDQKIAESLFGLAEIFKNNLTDYDQAMSYYQQLIDKYPKHDRVLESYFGLYQSNNKLGNSAEANRYKDIIVNSFPNSRYAVILSDPNYMEKLEIAELEQDSLYESSYRNYMQGNYEAVNQTYTYVLQKYPDTKLKPNFMFLNALITGINDSIPVFRSELEALQINYPKTAIAKQAASIIAQLDAGKKPSGEGADMSSLLAKRNDLLKELGMTQLADSLITGDSENNELYTNENEALHYFVMLIPSGRIDENQFLYEVARFNFTKFLIKDFDLSWVNYNEDTTMMIINGFNGLDESLWYQRTFILDQSLYDILSAIPYERMVISDRNFRALVTTRNLSAYQSFYRKNIKKQEGTIKDPFKKENISDNDQPKSPLNKNYNL